MESFLERRVQTSLGMDPSCERSNLSFQKSTLEKLLEQPMGGSSYPAGAGFSSTHADEQPDSNPELFLIDT
jgi:hypothetical protein